MVYVACKTHGSLKRSRFIEIRAAWSGKWIAQKFPPQKLWY